MIETDFIEALAVEERIGVAIGFTHDLCSGYMQ
jgi:hypothetical protein